MTATEDPRATDPVALEVEARTHHRSARRLARLLQTSLTMAWRADRRLLVAASALQLLSGLIALAQILIIKDVLATVLKLGGGSSAGHAVVPVSLLASVIAVATVAAAVQAQWQRLLSELVTRQAWEGVLDVATSVGLQEFESPQFYDHLRRVQSNALGRPYMITQALISLIGACASIIGLAVAVISLQPVLLPILLASGFPLYLGTRRGANLEFSFAVTQTPRLRLREYLMLSQLGRDEAKEIRAFGIGSAIRTRYDAVYSSYLQDLRRHVHRRSFVAVASSLGSALVLAATILAIVWMVSHHHLSLAGAGAAIIAVRLLAGQITSTFGNVATISESGLFLDDLGDFVTRRIAAEEEHAGEPAPCSFKTLAVERLSFTYPGCTRAAVRDVSLQLNAGEVVALVGENGSGKTTLAKLLGALYPPSSGTILWDGVDVSRYSREELRRSMGVIFQDFVRYQLAARTNIAFGRPEADDTDPAIIDAARQSGAAHGIERLANGYDTILSKAFAGGQELSGGQWQRIALARAFYRDSPFVILDEPSSALDPRAEHELFQSLRHLLAGKTVLYISHRLSTVRDADRIYVMAEGEIAEHGTHEDLMALDGRYAELFSLQAEAYLSEGAHA